MMSHRSNNSTPAHVARWTSPAVSDLLQRKCACGTHTNGAGVCDECALRNQSLQRDSRQGVAAAPASGEVPSSVHETLRAPGQPLDASTRTFFESRFGRDFSGVSVHTDSRASESAQALNALAYTAGREIVFAPGRFAPHSIEGRTLLAHELAHVVQQQNGGQSFSLQHFQISQPDDAYEREAEAVASAVMRQTARVRNESAIRTPPPSLLQRQPAPGRSCAGWEADAESFSKVIADFYLRTELGGTPGMADIQCQGDRRMCFVTYEGGTSVIVSLARVPDFVIARQRGGNGPRRDYVYDCDSSGRVNLRPRQ